MQKLIFSRLLISTLLLIYTAVTAAALPATLNGESLPSLSPMLKQTTPGVVNIATKGSVAMARNPLMNDPFFRFFFDVPRRPQKRQTQSLGSGVIIDAKQGYVVTNHHVIKEADEITVTLADRRTLNAELIGSDPEADIAVIQIKADNLTAIPLANSDALEVGDFVVAIGNPFGLGQTVTSGIISALGRTGLGIEGYEDFIQTDASINVGNSGGALVNLRGELVGINTAILAPNGGSVGIGFAIPSNMTQSIVKQLIEFGEVNRGLLGVSMQDITPELAKAFDVNIQGGAIVTEITPGSAADKAGLKTGDIVTAINGTTVDDASDLRNRVGLQRVGAKIKLSILRNDKPMEVTATLAAADELTLAGKHLHPNLAGATFGSTNKYYDNAPRTGIVILDVERGSPAWFTGLRKGDVIASVNRASIDNVSEFEDKIKRSGKQLLLHVNRGREAFYLVIK